MPKKLLLIYFLVSAFLILFGCAEKDEPKADTEAESETMQEATQEDESLFYTKGLSDERFDGYNYRIHVRRGASGTQYFEEPQEDVVNDAIYRRNKEVEERYGIKITCAEGEGNNTDTSAINTILAGDDAYDIIFTHSRSAFIYALQGTAYNIHDISSIKPENPWWSEDIFDSCSVNGKLYVIDGDISVNSLQCTMCMFFNKRIFDELGYDYPYETVEDGDWTFDEFAYYVKKGGADLDGDGVIIRENDRYGFVSSEWGAPINILYAGNQRIFDKDDEGNLCLSLYSNKTVEIYDEFFALMDNEACYIHPSNYDGANIFKEGRAMFYAENIGMAKTLRGIDDDFGIIPYPKFDEEDNYTTAINGYAPLGIIPITVSDAERTGAITEALAAYGAMYVTPAFYEAALKTKYARDEESEKMIDIIRDSVIFDMGYLCGSTYQSCGKDLAASADKNFASWYKARESQAEQNLANFIESYGG